MENKMQKNWFTSFLSGIWAAFRKSNTITTTTPIVDLSNTTTTLGDNKMKIALCVGINKYPNPANNLQGCVNDANDLASLLKNTYGFNEINMLLDSNANYSNVTNAIAEALAKKPDVFVYTNSSHGTRVPDTTGTEPDGYCEAICLYDKFLVDHDFHNILAKADPKTHVIVFSDSCHSAGVTREFLKAMNDSSYVSIPKYLPHPDNIEAFKATMAPTVKAIFEVNESMNEVLLAGCKSDQYSYDANFNGKPNGAFTYYTIQLLKNNPSTTYEDFVKAMTVYLPSSRYPQCPVCETNSNMEKTVIFS
jgi:hypothetical protein